MPGQQSDHGDAFELDAHEFRLLRNGEDVPLERRSFDLLCYLVDNPNRLISKDELLERVWHARVLGDGAVANCIAKLRKALNDDTRAPTCIETVYGRGYRWRGFKSPTTCEVPHRLPAKQSF
jgi:transcriptional activator of cad operon